MRRFLKITCATLAASLLFVALCACTHETVEDSKVTLDDGSRISQAGVLTFTASLHTTPFQDKTGYEPYGFTVDLAAAIAEELGLESAWTSSKQVDALAAGVQAQGDADVIASSLLASDTGSDNTLAYTDSYITFHLGVCVNKHTSYGSVRDLAGHKIGVAAGTDSEAYAKKLQEKWEKKGITGTEICAYDSNADALSDLQAKNIDGVIAEYPALKYYTRVMYYRENVIQELDDVTQGYVFAVSSDNEKLAEAINDALKELQDSGEYQKMYDSWFNVDEEASNPEDPTTPPQDQQGYVKGAW